jgi:hypothetical protein
MATFQSSDNKVLPLTVTLLVGNKYRFKVIPAKGELVPFKLLINPSRVVAEINDDVRKTANFQIVDVEALAVGLAQLSADNGRGGKAGPLTIFVKAPLVLPAKETEEGALARLLIAEAMSPELAGYDPDDVLVSMRWMRSVIHNRLKIKSPDFGTANAKSYTDVIKSYVVIKGVERLQFAGFRNYPTIAATQLETIDNILHVANDGADLRQKLYYAHVEAVIAVSGEKTITGPRDTVLYGWRTGGSSHPGGQFVKYKTFAGQDFYTIK